MDPRLVIFPWRGKGSTHSSTAHAPAKELPLAARLLWSKSAEHGFPATTVSAKTSAALRVLGVLRGRATRTVPVQVLRLALASALTLMSVYPIRLSV